MKRSIFRRGRTPVRPAHPAILRDAQGRVPYIKQSYNDFHKVLSFNM